MATIVEGVLVKSERIALLKKDRDNYISSKLSQAKKDGLNACLSAINMKLSDTTNLTQSDIDTLISYRTTIMSIFDWVTDVATYADSIEQSILNAASDEEAATVTWDFSQFDSTFTDTTVADKMDFIRSLP